MLIFPGPRSLSALALFTVACGLTGSAVSAAPDLSAQLTSVVLNYDSIPDPEASAPPQEYPVKFSVDMGGEEFHGNLRGVHGYTISQVLPVTNAPIYVPPGRSADEIFNEAVIQYVKENFCKMVPVGNLVFYFLNFLNSGSDWHKDFLGVSSEEKAAPGITYVAGKVTVKGNPALPEVERSVACPPSSQAQPVIRR